MKTTRSLTTARNAFEVKIKYRKIKREAEQMKTILEIEEYFQSETEQEREKNIQALLEQYFKNKEQELGEDLLP